MLSLKKIFLTVIFLLSASIISYAADSIVLTTYYPSPYGVYNEIRSKRMAIGDTYYDTATFPWEEADGDGGKIDYLADLVVEGNVGIGTTEPGGNLDIAVSDTSNILAGTVDQYALRFLNTDTTNNNWVLMTFDDASNNNPVAAFGARITDHSNNYGDLGFATRSSAGWSEKMRILSSGYVGIGTTTPAAVLDVYTTTAWSGGWMNNLRLSSTTFPMLRFFATSINKSSSIGTNNDGGLWFGINGTGDVWGSTYGMVIAPTGLVGIGTSTPGGTLHIYRSDYTYWPITAYNGGATYLAMGPLNASWAHYQTNASSGNYFYNYVYFAASYGSSSSRTLKKNITPIKDPLDKISKLNGVYFDWKSNGKHGIGLIAEDVNRVVPEVVMTAKDGTVGLSYDKLVALTIEGIKEQQAQIDALRAQNAQLEAKIKKLEAKQ